MGNMGINSAGTKNVYQNWQSSKTKCLAGVLREGLTREILARHSYPHPVLTLRIPVMCKAHASLRGTLSRKTPAGHFILLVCTIWYTLSVPTLYIPTFPQMLRSTSERKPKTNTLKVRDYHTHISLHLCLWISSTPTSPFPYHWEVDSPNTYYTLSECQVKFWCCWEVLEEAKDGICNMELITGFGKLDKTRFQEALLE